MRQPFAKVPALTFACSILLVSSTRSASGNEVPSWDKVEQIVLRYFDSAWDKEHVHFMTQGHAKTVFTQLEQLGWRIEDPKSLMKDIPADSEFLIQQLASPQGQAMLKHLPDEKLLYDRLDRLIQRPGGRRLVRDLIRLPDGYRYAKSKRPRGVPAMKEFLPKTSKGKDAKIENYNKPTGRIYTLELFLDRLRKVHEVESQM